MTNKMKRGAALSLAALSILVASVSLSACGSAKPDFTKVEACYQEVIDLTKAKLESIPGADFSATLDPIKPYITAEYWDNAWAALPDSAKGDGNAYVANMLATCEATKATLK